MRPITATLSVFLAAILLMTASAEERNPARTRPGAAAEQAAAQRVIVKFRQSSALSTQAAKRGEAAVADTAKADTARMNALASRARVTLHGSKGLGGNMYVMRLSAVAPNETAAETLARLRADSDVEFAELDRRVYLHATDTNDPHYLLNTAEDLGQWYLRDTEKSAINARAAWDISKSSKGVVVAVVDTGVLFSHEDLVASGIGGKLLPGFDFISQDSENIFDTAADGNGPDADPSDPGDFCGNIDGGGSSWHGTRVSGIIAARTNNNLGTAGIDWNAYLLPVRVIGRCGGYNSDVIAGIRWAAGLSVPGVPDNPYPAQVINISLGSQGPCDAAAADAISEVTAAGALAVVSAGNEGGPVDSPASCPGAMAILGLRNVGTKVGFSNLGQDIALGAPGGNCVNDTFTNPTLPCVYSIDTSTNSGKVTPGADSYTDKNSANTNVGTSFSAPIVSGIAGLMLSVNGNLRGTQLMARMKEGASPYPTSSDTPDVPNCQDPLTLGFSQLSECICTTAVCGAGMANAYNSVLAALRPIAAVAVPSSYAPGGSVTLDGAGSGAACHQSIASYSWTIDGAVISSSPTATVTAPATDPATVVRLTVTDDAGKTDFADVTVSATSAHTDAPSAAGTKACLADIAAASDATTTATITATDADAAEANSDPGVFTLTRTGNTDAALTLTITIAGTATMGADYLAMPATVTIPAGSPSATLTVTPIEDTIPEGEQPETVNATLQPASGYQIGDSSSAVVSIADNDTVAAPPPSPPSAQGSSGGGGGALDPLTLLGSLAFALFATFRRRLVGVDRSRVAMEAGRVMA